MHGLWATLDVVILIEDEKKKSIEVEVAIELMSRIMADPKLRQQFEKYKMKQITGREGEA